MSITLQDRVYFGDSWYLLDGASPGNPIALGNGFANQQVIRADGGEFFAGIVEKVGRNGAVTDVVLSFAGVQTSTVDTALLVAGITVVQADRAVALYEQLLHDPRYADATIHVTGHSAGAGLTQYVASYSLATYGAVATDARADFQAFGSPSWGEAIALHFGLQTNALDGHYSNYTAANDPVLLNGTGRTGTTYYLPAYEEYLPGANEVAAHGPFAYILALGLPDWLDAAQQQAVIDALGPGAAAPYDPGYATPGLAPLVVDGDAAGTVLVGMGGNDTITGGAGRDVMSGGGGADVFRFETIGDSGATITTADRITDFGGDDRIDLSAIDARQGGGLFGIDLVNDAFTFIGGAGFSAAGQVRAWTHGGNTFVAGDVNGDRVADFVVVLDHQIDLTAANFIL